MIGCFLLFIFVSNAPAEARRLTREGAILFQAREYGQALQLYQAAYEKEPSPGLLFEIARCHKSLGEHAQVVTVLKRYLVTRPAQRQRTAAELMIAESEAALADQPRLVRPVTTPPAQTAYQPYEHPSIASRWWFWTGVLGIIGVVGGVTAGVIVGLNSKAAPAGSLGVVDARTSR